MPVHISFNIIEQYEVKAPRHVITHGTSIFGARRGASSKLSLDFFGWGRRAYLHDCASTGGRERNTPSIQRIHITSGVNDINVTKPRRQYREIKLA